MKKLLFICILVLTTINVLSNDVTRIGFKTNTEQLCEFNSSSLDFLNCRKISENNHIWVLDFYNKDEYVINFEFIIIYPDTEKQILTNIIMGFWDNDDKESNIYSLLVTILSTGEEILFTIDIVEQIVVGIYYDDIEGVLNGEIVNATVFSN